MARLKKETILAYGGACACCGEFREPFLTIDHIYRDGKFHRKVLGIKGGAMLYLDLKRRGWPKDRFRLLCMNCNFATRYGGACPHVAERVLEAVS